MPLVLNHFTVRTSDVESYKNFYTTILGLTNGPRPAFAFPGAWLYRGSHEDTSNAVVHIIGLDAASASEEHCMQTNSPLDHIAFSATGLEEMLQHLQQHAVPYAERTVPNLGLHQVFLHDPLNIKIELNYQKFEKEQLDVKNQA